jgi:CheY-like chemotaxis protein
MPDPWNTLKSLFRQGTNSTKSRQIWKSRPATLLNKKVIILDDELASREVLASELNKRGYTAIPMESKAEGYHWIVDNQPDLIISDIKSPRMDGFELLKMLKANPFTSEIPFIFVTAYSDYKRIEAARELGATEFMSKPYDIKKLTKMIERILKITH